MSHILPPGGLTAVPVGLTAVPVALTAVPDGWLPSLEAGGLRGPGLSRV